MGRFLVFLIGASLGAALFHLYYLRLAPAVRCGWDHPIDREARSACTSSGTTPATYTAKARHALDDLVGNVSN